MQCLSCVAGEADSSLGGGGDHLRIPLDGSWAALWERRNKNVPFVEGETRIEGPRDEGCVNRINRQRRHS